MPKMMDALSLVMGIQSRMEEKLIIETKNQRLFLQK
jgi:hypothetical protein